MRSKQALTRWLKKQEKGDSDEQEDSAFDHKCVLAGWLIHAWLGPLVGRSIHTDPFLLVPDLAATAWWRRSWTTSRTWSWS